MVLIRRVLNLFLYCFLWVYGVSHAKASEDGSLGSDAPLPLLDNISLLIHGVILGVVYVD